MPDDRRSSSTSTSSSTRSTRSSGRTETASRCRRTTGRASGRSRCTSTSCGTCCASGGPAGPRGSIPTTRTSVTRRPSRAIASDQLARAAPRVVVRHARHVAHGAPDHGQGARRAVTQGTGVGAPDALRRRHAASPPGRCPRRRACSRSSSTSSNTRSSCGRRPAKRSTSPCATVRSPSSGANSSARCARSGSTPSSRPRPRRSTDPIPFPEDTTHHTYDAEAATRFWQVLATLEPVFEEYRADVHRQGVTGPVLLGECRPHRHAVPRTTSR